MPKFVLLHGSLKTGAADPSKPAPKPSKPGDVVEMPQAEADSMPDGVLMPAADFEKVLGSSLANKLKALKDEARSPEMRVKPDKQTPIAGPTAPAVQKGA